MYIILVSLFLLRMPMFFNYDNNNNNNHSSIYDFVVIVHGD